MIEINNTTKVKINNKLIKKTVEKFLTKNKKVKKDISIAFIGDNKIKELNNNYRKKDKTTDVLSFEGEGNFLGEVLINPNQIKRQIKESGNSFKEELIFILVHGLLHLVGYNDETEKDRLKMIKLGKNFIKTIG